MQLFNARTCYEPCHFLSMSFTFSYTMWSYVAVKLFFFSSFEEDNVKWTNISIKSGQTPSLISYASSSIRYSGGNIAWSFWSNTTVPKIQQLQGSLPVLRTLFRWSLVKGKLTVMESTDTAAKTGSVALLRKSVVWSVLLQCI